MSNEFIKKLDDAGKFDVDGIEKPVEDEIREIFSRKIEEMNFVRKSEFESLINETLKKILSEKKIELKMIIREAVIRELIQGNWGIKENLKDKHKTEKPVVHIKEKTPQVLVLKPDPKPEKKPVTPPIPVKLSLKDFLGSRQFSSRNQKFRGVAYFLTKIQNTPNFNIKDLREAYEKADLPIHPNFGITARDNVKSGFFENVSEKKDGFVTWKITEKTFKEFEGGAL